jgi:hypothetical protein
MAGAAVVFCGTMLTSAKLTPGAAAVNRGQAQGDETFFIFIVITFFTRDS